MSIPESNDAPKGFTFHSLGQSAPQHPEHEAVADVRKEVHWTARKACAVLKVTSSVVSALAVSPGGDASEAELTNASSIIMSRAAELTDAALSILSLNPTVRGAASYKNLLRQQAVEFASVQWRSMHLTGTDNLPVAKVAALYEKILRDIPVHGDGETMALPADIDPITARRVSLMAVTPEIYQAVASFDYFAPEPGDLVADGVTAIVRAVDHGMNKMVHRDAAVDTATMVAQSLIGKLGSLYAANYNAQARADVMRLEGMDEDERMSHIHAYRKTGLPTAHIEASFGRLAARLVDMVCDAIPELAAQPAEPLQGAATALARNNVQPE